MAFTAAFGTLLQREISPGSGTFTTVSQIGADISGPGQKGDTIDTTTHNQATPYKSFMSGLKEGGDVKFPLFFDPSDATHTVIISDFEAGVPVNYKLVPPFSPAAAWSFAALVVDISHTYKIKDAVMAEVTFKVSGKPTLALV
jgi:Lambda phage tail tube protein, TTP